MQERDPASNPVDPTPPEALPARHADLLDRVAQFQDREAFGELFAFFAPRIKSFIKRQGASDAQAEDIAQDAMVQVWRRAETFDRRQAGVSTWIFRIARNRRIDVFRREQRPQLDPDDPGLSPPDAPTAEQSVQAGQVELAVQRALTHLPPEQVELLRLAFYEGLSHSELAERVGVPLGTVKSRIRLAFAKLKGYLEDHAPG